MYKHILIPTDGSDLSLKAIQHGILLAKAVRAKVTSITVVSPVLLFNLEPDKFAEPSKSGAISRNWKALRANASIK